MFLVHLVFGVLAGNSLVSIKILDIDRPCPRLLHGPQVDCKLNLHVKGDIDQNWDQILVDFKIFNDTMIFINCKTSCLSNGFSDTKIEKLNGSSQQTKWRIFFIYYAIKSLPIIGEMIICMWRFLHNCSP